MNVKKKKKKDHERKKVWVIIYKLHTYRRKRPCIFHLWYSGLRPSAKLLEDDWHCKYLLSLFFFEVFSPSISAPLSRAFCCYVPLPILQFRVKTGIMQEVMGCGSEREEIRMLLDSHPFLLRSRAKQFQGKGRYTIASRLWSCDASGWKYVGSSQSFLHC